MPQLTVEEFGTFEVAAGKRLVNALIDEAATDQLHACGGLARCTTCRVQFIDGEPAAMTLAERQTLQARGIESPGVRLSCQITCGSDMKVQLISRLQGSGRSDQGNRPADSIEPEPQW